MALKILTAIKSYYPTSMPVNWRWGYYLNSYKVGWLALKELTASQDQEPDFIQPFDLVGNP